MEYRKYPLGKIGSGWRHFLRHENIVLVIVLIGTIFGFGGATKGQNLASLNVLNVLLQSAIRGIASIGQAFVMISGGIDVSVGANGLFAAVLGARLMTESWQNIVGHPLPIYLSMLLMILGAMAWGLFHGLAVSRIGMPALIVTLATWQIITGAAFLVSDGMLVGQLPDNLAFWGSGKIGGVFVPVIMFVVQSIIAYFVLMHTTFGRSVYAAGGNAVSAWLSGIDVRRITVVIYLISAFCAGLAGVVMTARVMSASMKTLSGLEIDSIAAVVVGGVSLAGGKGNIIGVFLGVLIIGFTNNGMSLLGAGPAEVNIVKGLIIFFAVAIDYLRRR
ncbi:ABC transporter permease [Chloroflexota bacterium]